MPTLTYSVWWQRLWILITLPIFAVVAVGLIVGSVLGAKGPEGPFLVLWVLAFVWNAYWWLLRIAYRLDLTETELLWRTPLRKGRIQLVDLVELRPFILGSNVEIVISRQERKVMVIVTRGFADYLDEITARAPHVKARIGLGVRIASRFPGPRGYKPPTR